MAWLNMLPILLMIAAGLALDLPWVLDGWAGPAR